MLDSNTILEVKGYLKCEDYSHGILSQEWENWPCGTPIIYSTADMDKNRGSVDALSLMAPSQRAGGNWLNRTPSSLIVPVNMKPLKKNHKVLTVDHFDFDKFVRLREYVQDVGGLSLVIEPSTGRNKLVDEIRKIGNTFNYKSLFYYSPKSPQQLNGKDDRYICVLTFLDLSYCVPIFNIRKVDGLGLSLSGTTVKASEHHGRLFRIFRADFIYSNFLDNIFVTDGVEVNSLVSIPNDILTNMEGLVRQELKVGPEKKMSASAKTKSPKRERAYDKNYSFEQTMSEWNTTHVTLESISLKTFDEGNEVVAVSGETTEDEAAPEEMTEDEATPSYYSTASYNATWQSPEITSSDGNEVPDSSDGNEVPDSSDVEF